MLSAFILCLFFSWLIVVCDFILCLPYRIRLKLSLLKRNGIDQPQECPYLVLAQYSGEDGGPPWWTVPIPPRFFCEAAKLGQAGTTHDQLAQRRTDHEQLAQSSPKMVPGFCPYSTCSRSPHGNCALLPAIIKEQGQNEVKSAMRISICIIYALGPSA